MYILYSIFILSIYSAFQLKNICQQLKKIFMFEQLLSSNFITNIFLKSIFIILNINLPSHFINQLMKIIR